MPQGVAALTQQTECESGQSAGPRPLLTSGWVGSLVGVTRSFSKETDYVGARL